MGRPDVQLRMRAYGPNLENPFAYLFSRLWVMCREPFLPSARCVKLNGMYHEARVLWSFFDPR